METGKKCLAVYDITGIQDFVFAGNKARENIGASIMLENVLKITFPSVLDTLNGEVSKDWTNSSEFLLKSDSNLKAEVIYIGGGNALVVFDTIESAREVTKNLSLRLFEETRGTLAFAVAYHETNLEDFQEDKERLFEKLFNNKSKLCKSTPLRGLSITRECEDGLPWCGENECKRDGIHISCVANAKNKLVVVEEEELEYKEKRENFLGIEIPPGYEFPLEFSKLGQRKGDSHLAVVHIDGNSMGKFIDDELSGITDYSEAVKRMRKLSNGIHKIYKGVFNQLIKDISEGIKDSEVQKVLKLEDRKLPLRPLILSGDDVTFVCDGRIGIQLAVHFLKLLSKAEVDSNVSENISLSACAGIAIVKSKFPFYRAYALAEDLCSSAKKKAKSFDRDNPGCWFDYHIVYSGFELDLDEMRHKFYNVPGMDPVSKGEEKLDYEKYNLLLRPFCVTTPSPKPAYAWDKMLELFIELQKSEKWPRSRLKNLRNNFIKSKTDVELVQATNTSRGCSLPSYEMMYSDEKCENGKMFLNNQTPYFEPLELLDMYVKALDFAGGGE